MGYLYNAARDFKNSVPALRSTYAWLRRTLKPTVRDMSYAGRLAAEHGIYADAAEVHELPAIFHYWSNRHIRPMIEEYGFSNPDQFFAKYLAESARIRAAASPVFLSIGAGNCDTEVRVAGLLRDGGWTDFTIECLDINPSMLRRGREMAEREGVSAHVVTTECDFNDWKATRAYDGVMASQSLHHAMKLEGLFDEVRGILGDGGYFVIDDIIGRNGHQRWPEALAAVRDFWRELPRSYRYNRQLDRYERRYINWDCSTEGFEGIRAEDILPLLIERFDFRMFVGFANVVDVFVDRAFGHNFDADAQWDRTFVDRLHAFDEDGFRNGTLTPTHMMAVLTSGPCAQHTFARGLTPAQSVRR